MISIPTITILCVENRKTNLPWKEERVCVCIASRPALAVPLFHSLLSWVLLHAWLVLLFFLQFSDQNRSVEALRNSVSTEEPTILIGFMPTQRQLNGPSPNIPPKQGTKDGRFQSALFVCSFRLLWMTHVRIRMSARLCMAIGSKKMRRNDKGNHSDGCSTMVMMTATTAVFPHEMQSLNTRQTSKRVRQN